MTNNHSTILSENTMYKNSLGLEAIPEEIFDCLTLEKLDLSYNKISKIDKRLSLFQSLKYLDLSNNQLREIPPFLADLRQLEVLILSNNQLSEFPAVLTELPSLTILKIKANKIKSIPSNIHLLDKLEVLDLAFNPLEALPMEMAALRQLKVLVCTSNYFSDFPTVLLEMEQLEQVEHLDLDFRLKLPTPKLKVFFKVLQQLKKQKASLELKMAAAQLFLFQNYTGTLSEILPLLSIRYVEFFQKIRDYLNDNYTKELTESSKIAILGKTEWMNVENIVSDIEITTEIKSDTTHIVLGRQMSKPQIASLRTDLAFVAEKELLHFLFPKQPAGWLEEHQDRLLDLLLSGQDANITLALQLAKDSELLGGLLTELLLAYTEISAGNADLRNEIKEIFYLNIPDFQKITLPNPAFQFYTSHKSEEAILQSIHEVSSQCMEWDGLKIANYIFKKHKAGYGYILKYSDLEQEKEWLLQFFKGDKMTLTNLSKLKDLPKSLGLFQNLRILNLNGCAFRKFPEVELLAQLPNLEEIDLRNNPITFIPKIVYTKISRYRVYLSK